VNPNHSELFGAAAEGSEPSIHNMHAQGSQAEDGLAQAEGVFQGAAQSSLMDVLYQPQPSVRDAAESIYTESNDAAMAAGIAMSIAMSDEPVMPSLINSPTAEEAEVHNASWISVRTR
jgi:hypothetical protein